MSTCLFRSPLAPRLQTFLDMRRALGRSGISDQKILIYLDRFLMGELQPGQTITREVVESWIKSTEHLSVATRINRLSVLRQFCLYQWNFDPRTYLVPRSSLPRRTRTAPYIYTPQEVRAIMTAAKKIGPPGSLRPAVLATLIGLLYATGMRVGEALKLTHADVDLKRRLLLIRQTKFRKSRYVPLSRSTTSALAAFLRRCRAAGYSPAPTAPLFITSTGRAYGLSRVCSLFLEVMRKIGLRGPIGSRGPRIHDFRHAFAVQRLAAWYRQGAHLMAKLPLLTTYLGHTTVTCTEVYLQATVQLLDQASKRFHKHCVIPFSGKGGDPCPLV